MTSLHLCTVVEVLGGIYIEQIEKKWEQMLFPSSSGLLCGWLRSLNDWIIRGHRPTESSKFHLILELLRDPPPRPPLENTDTHSLMLKSTRWPLRPDTLFPPNSHPPQKNPPNPQPLLEPLPAPPPPSHPELLCSTQVPVKALTDSQTSRVTSWCREREREREEGGCLPVCPQHPHNTAGHLALGWWCGIGWGSVRTKSLHPPPWNIKYSL